MGGQILLLAIAAAWRLRRFDAATYNGHVKKPANFVAQNGPIARRRPSSTTFESRRTAISAQAPPTASATAVRVPRTSGR
jgi:hypothetical protein